MDLRCLLFFLCCLLPATLLPAAEPSAIGQQVRPSGFEAEIFDSLPTLANPVVVSTGIAFKAEQGITTTSQLVNGIRWWYVQWSFFKEGWSKSRDLERFNQLPAPILPAPTGLSPGSGAIASAPLISVVNPELKWTSVIGADAYFVRILVYENAAWVVLDEEFTLPIPSLVVGPGLLKANRTYSWYVWTYNVDGYSSLTSSNALYFKTLATLDTIRPVLSITSPAEASVFGNAVISVTGTAADARGLAKVMISLNSAPEVLAEGTSSWTFAANLRNGGNTITAYSVDNAGNVSLPATLTVIYVPDTTPPTVRIAQPAANLITGLAAFAFSGTANDNKTIAAVEVRWDSNNWLPASGTTAWSYSGPLSLGRHTLSVRARDTAGNFSPVVAVVVSRRSVLAAVTPMPSPQPGSLQFGVIGTPGMGYFVERSLNLINWQRISGSEFLGLGNGNDVIIPDQVQSPASYFRVVENAQ